MAQISVTWKDGKPYAEDTTIRGNNSTVVTWVPDSTVVVTGISRPKDGDKDDFTTPSRAGNSDNWECTDSCNNIGQFTYTITGYAEKGGPVASHDPKITNDRG